MWRLPAELLSPSPLQIAPSIFTHTVASSLRYISFLPSVTFLTLHFAQVVPVGCSPPLPPTFGPTHLLQHNQTHATYQCRSGHLFPSLLPTATLLCTGHSYHSPLPTCISISSLLSSSNTTVVQALLAKNSTRGLATRTPHITTVWLQEVLLPLVLTVSTLVLSLTGLILLLLMKRHMAAEANNLHSQHCTREPTRDTLVVSTLDMRNAHTLESNHLF